MNWKIIWKSLRQRDMQKRVLGVLGILIVFRIMTNIPVPLGNAQNIHQILGTLFNSKNTPQLLVEEWP